MNIEIEELGNVLGTKNSLNKTSYKRAREKLQMRKEIRMKERDVEVLLREGVKQLGGKAYKWVSPGNAGVPDRIVILPGGKVIFVELKQENGRLTRLQKVQQEQLTRLKVPVATLYGIADVRKFLDWAKEHSTYDLQSARVSKVLH